jgi:lipopolysaccharide export system protein LptA
MPICNPEQKVRFMNYCTRILALLLSFSAAFAIALPEDRDQPMRITADKAERDDINGITIYRGNVVLIQGTLKLESDTLTIYLADEEPTKIIAEGSPAKMQTRPELDKAMVYARGEVITYYRPEERVNMQTNGYVAQDGSVVEGDSIDYFIEKQLIKAESDQSREGDKVVHVIPPSATKKKENSGTTKSE